MVLGYPVTGGLESLKLSSDVREKDRSWSVSIITSTYFHGRGGGGGVWVEGEREEAGAAQLIVTKIGGTVKVQ